MWSKMMDSEGVAYHVPTVLPSEVVAVMHEEQTGETALRWAGAGCADLALYGPVTMSAYTAIFGPGGVRHPTSETLLVACRRPGAELVNYAPKSVAVLSACGRSGHAHAILEADTAAQLAHLDDIITCDGGRLGRARVRCGTHGLTVAVTRHSTSRAGDPYCHHHVLVANVVTLVDGHGYRALDSRMLYRNLSAAAKAGRTAGASMAADLGYHVESVIDRKGEASHWRIAGVPPILEDLFSKRTAQMSEAADELHAEGKHASRRVLVAATRGANGPKNPDMAMLAARWRDEMTAAGWPPEAVLAAVDEAAQGRGAA